MDTEPQSSQHRWRKRCRWLAVWPGAYLASWIFVGVLGAVMSLIGVDLRHRAEFVFQFQRYLISGVAFSAVGGWLAPAKRVATASILAALCIVSSLAIHILSQPAPGRTNYLHFSGEAVGALVGIGLIVLLSRRSA